MLSLGALIGVVVVVEGVCEEKAVMVCGDLDAEDFGHYRTFSSSCIALTVLAMPVLEAPPPIGSTNIPYFLSAGLVGLCKLLLFKMMLFKWTAVWRLRCLLV
jgi:hypothetical protein